MEKVASNLEHLPLLIVPLLLEREEFIKLMTGQATGQSLFMSGKLKIQGNMGLAMKLDKIPKVSKDASPSTPAPKQAAPAASGGAGQFRASAVFDGLAKNIASNPDLVKTIGGVYQFDISSAGKTKTWTVDLKNGKGSVTEGPGKADCTITAADDDFVGMMTGKLNSQQLFMQGKLKIKGNMGLAMKLGKLSSAKASL